MEEQRRREAEEAANLRAAQDMSRLSLGSQASSSSVPPPPPHHPPSAYSVRARLSDALCKSIASGRSLHSCGHGSHGCWQVAMSVHIGG